MKLLIGADIVPVLEQYEDFVNGNVGNIVDSKWFDLMEDCDFACFNLETPITDRLTPIIKQGKNFHIPEKTINGIKRLNPYFFTLANNHIMDQGSAGLQNTRKILEDHGISYAGAGRNLKEAGKSYIRKCKGIKLGIYCCAENEYSIAGNEEPGANPFDPLYSLDHIFELKQECDYVLVLYHGGKEFYRYPSPRLQEVCRRMVDKGADLVVCQHSHCIGCKEEWNQGTIIYGQGNACFTKESDEYWNTALLLSVDIDGGLNKIEYIPLQTEDNKVCFAENKQKEDILRDFYGRSEEIKDADFVEKMYADFSDKFFEFYITSVHGNHLKSIAFKMVNRLTGRRLKKKLYKKYYGKNDLLKIQNFVRCEAHRELLLKGIEHKI